MAFDAQQIFPIDFNESAAVGVNIPFSGPAVFISNYQTKDAIKNNLINFFLTNPGERFLNPTFGGGIRDFIFEQISTGNINFLKKDIETKINLFFPNIEVDSLEIFSNPDINLVRVELTYSVINTNINDNIEIEFT
jgi:phage baseplate assembly protein W